MKPAPQGAPGDCSAQPLTCSRDAWVESSAGDRVAVGEALRATAAGAKGVGAKPEAAGWRLAVVGVRPALLGKEVARPAERGVGRLPCGSSPPNGDTRMARRCPWSLQWRRDSRQAAPLGQGHGWSRGRYSLVDVSRFMPLRWARLDDSTGSSRGARGVLFRAK